MKFTKYITNNFFAKFMSLTLAFFFWVFVMASSTRLGVLPKAVEVKVQNVQAGLAVAEDPGSVKIKIKAPESIYKKVTPDNFDVSIDASSMKTGGAEQLEVKVVSKDPAVQVVGTEPSRILLKLEDVDSKKMSLVLRYKGKPDSDYKVGAGEVLTKEVEIQGAPTKLNQINEAAAYLELKGTEKGSIDGELPIVALDENENFINYLSFFPQKAEARLEILPKIESKTVGIKVNFTGEAAKGYWVSKVKTDPDVVTVKGEAEVVKDLEFVETEKIDLANTNTGLASRVKLKLPDKVELAENKDVIVQVFVAKLDSAKTLTPAATFRGLGDGLRAEIVSDVAVTLTGSMPSLNLATTENVFISLDLSNLNIGTHKLVLNKGMVTKPSDVEVSKLAPEYVTVKITGATDAGQ